MSDRGRCVGTHHTDSSHVHSDGRAERHLGKYGAKHQVRWLTLYLTKGADITGRVLHLDLRVYSARFCNKCLTKNPRFDEFIQNLHRSTDEFIVKHWIKCTTLTVFWYDMINLIRIQTIQPISNPSMWQPQTTSDSSTLFVLISRTHISWMSGAVTHTLLIFHIT